MSGRVRPSMTFFVKAASARLMLSARFSPRVDPSGVLPFVQLIPDRFGQGAVGKDATGDVVVDVDHVRAATAARRASRCTSGKAGICRNGGKASRGNTKG